MSKPGCEYYWFLHGCRPEPSKEIIGYNPEREAYRKSIGNHFSSEEDAEKAREKMKAFTNLCKNGFKFTGWDCDETTTSIKFNFTIKAEANSAAINDLDLLFGGEE